MRDSGRARLLADAMRVLVWIHERRNSIFTSREFREGVGMHWRTANRWLAVAEGLKLVEIQGLRGPWRVVDSARRGGPGPSRFDTPVAAGSTPAPVTISDDWLPTPDAINALPKGLRDYIHQIQADCDPAGTVARAVLAEDNARALACLVATPDTPSSDSSPGSLARTARSRHSAEREGAAESSRPPPAARGSAARRACS